MQRAPSQGVWGLGEDLEKFRHTTEEKRLKESHH